MERRIGVLGLQFGVIVTQADKSDGSLRQLPFAFVRL